MKKIIKISFVIILLSSFLVTQSALGAFGVVEGQLVKYKLTKASNVVVYESLQEEFVGFNASNTIIESNTIAHVTIDSVVGSNVIWNSTFGDITISGVDSEDVNPITYSDYFVRGLYLKEYTHANIWQIYDSGEFNPFYNDIFGLPLFVGIAPANWDYLEGLCLYQDTYLNNYYILSRVTDYDATCTKENDIITIEWYFSYFYEETMMPPNELYTFNTTTTFSYDMVTGILLNMDSIVEVIGEYSDEEYTITSEYSIEKTDISDFMEFLIKNKWYFIGGGAGIVALAIIIPIVVVVIKKRK